MKKMIARTKDLLDPLCEAEGVELVHLECQREAGGRILRLYIDKPGGVTLDDCIHVSRQSSDMLDVYLEETGPFNLEVSSPGQNRPLGKKSDFDRFKGNRVNIRTAPSVGGKKKINGVLLGISEDAVKVSIDDQIVVIPYHEIVTARLANNIPKERLKPDS
ncbi:MAG: ribosome maturation factor RimP [Deltaproteobacteria bacterium]|nr:ribosome maturation factor RimP [Deltaproteobacteria bacterium]